MVIEEPFPLSVETRCAACKQLHTTQDQGVVTIHLPKHQTDYMCVTCWGNLLTAAWAWFQTRNDPSTDARKLFQESLEATLRSKFD